MRFRSQYIPTVQIIIKKITAEPKIYGYIESGTRPP